MLRLAYRRQHFHQKEGHGNGFEQIKRRLDERQQGRQHCGSPVRQVVRKDSAVNQKHGVLGADALPEKSLKPKPTQADAPQNHHHPAL